MRVVAPPKARPAMMRMKLRLNTTHPLLAQQFRPLSEVPQLRQKQVRQGLEASTTWALKGVASKAWTQLPVLISEALFGSSNSTRAACSLDCSMATRADHHRNSGDIQEPMRIAWKTSLLIPFVLLFSTFPACAQSGKSAQSAASPQGPFTDYRYEKPGATHKITAKDLPAPYATKSATNWARVVARPKNAWPQAPAGFKVELFATGLDHPRKIVTAPNGDILLTQSDNGVITIFRGITADGKPQQTQTFATGLGQPYGIAFYPPGPEPAVCLYRRHRRRGAFPLSQRRPEGGGKAAAHRRPAGRRTLDSRPGFFTRRQADVRRRRLRLSNIDDPDTHPDEKNRGDILVMNPDGSNLRVYAYGIRNAWRRAGRRSQELASCGVR